MLVNLMLIAALVGCVQPYKFLSKPPPSGEEPQGEVSSGSSSYYVAPIYMPSGSASAARYQYPQSSYKQLEFTKYAQPQEGRATYSAGGYLQPGYNPYPQQPMQPPVAYLVVRPAQPLYPQPLYPQPSSYGRSTPLLRQSGTKGGEPQRLQQETKGQEPERLQQEIKGQEPPRLQQEAKGQEPQRLQPETKGQSYYRPQQEQFRDEQQEQEPEGKRPPTPAPAPKPEPEQADAFSQYHAAKQSKIAKLKSSISKFASLAKSKITLGSTYQVTNEEIIQPPPPPPPQPQLNQDEQQQEEQQQEQEQISTEVPLQEPERQEPIKGYPQREIPAKGYAYQQQLPSQQPLMKAYHSSSAVSDDSFTHVSDLRREQVRPAALNNKPQSVSQPQSAAPMVQPSSQPAQAAQQSPPQGVGANANIVSGASTN